MITGNEFAFASMAAMSNGTSWKQEGLTIRQHFAAMAMQGFVANAYQSEDMDLKQDMPPGEQVARYVKGAVMIADALIAELNKQTL